MPGASANTDVLVALGSTTAFVYAVVVTFVQAARHARLRVT
jgi:hypothetical protein